MSEPIIKINIIRRPPEPPLPIKIDEFPCVLVFNRIHVFLFISLLEVVPLSIPGMIENPTILNGVTYEFENGSKKLILSTWHWTKPESVSLTVMLPQ